jgi:hypothetical protein
LERGRFDLPGGRAAFRRVRSGPVAAGVARTGSDEVTDPGAWAWATRALLAQRNGDAAEAMRCVRTAQELRADAYDRSLVVVVRALVNLALGHEKEARVDVEEAARIIDRLLPYSLRGRWRNHDVLTPLAGSPGATRGGPPTLRSFAGPVESEWSKPRPPAT